MRVYVHKLHACMCTSLYVYERVHPQQTVMDLHLRSCAWLVC